MGHLITSQNYITISVLTLVFSIIIDLIMGDPELKIHPVMLIGKSIGYFKKKLLKKKAIWDKFAGIILILIVIFLYCIPIFLIQIGLSYVGKSWNNIDGSATGTWLNWIIFIYSLIMGFILKWSFAIKNLGDVSRPIYSDLKNSNLKQARFHLSWIVRRNTNELNENLIISATVECIAESSTDSATGVFWFYGISILCGAILYNLSSWTPWLFIGVPFSYIFRILNTGDSVVGYKDEENINIGWFSAKMDDFANFIPTRLTVCCMIIIGLFMNLNVKNALKVLKSDRNSIESLNAGWTMSVMAGLLGVQLEKVGKYKLGCNLRELRPKDILTSFRNVKYSTFLFVLLICGMCLIIINCMIF